MKSKLIVILSLARSGSSNLVKLFKNFKYIDHNTEVFNPDLKFSFNNIKNRDKLRIKYGNNYKNFIIENCLYEECLKLIIDSSNKKFIVIKILDYQVPFEQIIKIINISYKVLFLERKNILDRYISIKKANMIQEWAHVDTTNINIVFNQEDYNKFKKHHITINDKFKELLIKNKNMTYIKYKNTINPMKILSRINIIIPELKIKNIKNIICLQIQDKSKSYKKKIKNYEEFKDFIDKEIKTFN